MGLDSGLYIIRPKVSQGVLLIGPATLPQPPPDLPVRVGNGPTIDRWLVRSSGRENTYNVFYGRGRNDEYKWITKGDGLFVSAFPRPPGDFRFETAGDNFYTIGLPNEDSLLTVDRFSFPECTFRPANGNDSQLFEVIRIDRE